MPGEEIKTTLQFQADITDFKGAMQEANRAVKLANSEFAEASSGMDDWSKSTDGITAKLQQLANVQAAEERKLAVLKKAYADVVKEQGENSKAAQELQIKINNQQAAVNKTKKAYDNYSNSLNDAGEETKDLADASKEAESGLQSLEKVGGAVTATMAAIGAAVAGVVTAFFASAEATRDYRRDMAQMAQNAADTGHDMADLKETLSDVSAVTGEADAAMEGLNMLMASGLNTQDLETAAAAFAGAASKFDGLKFEGMAEGLQETLATGAAVGPFGELIERTGGNLESFNAGLAACTTEAQKQQYVMDWLANSGLQDVHDAYVQNNSDLVEAEKAQFRLNDRMAEIGAIAEPVMTSLKNMGADLLGTITPFVGLIGEGLTAALNGSAGAASALSEGIGGLLTSLVGKATEMVPMLLEVVTTVIPTVITAIVEALPEVIAAIVQVVPQLVTALLGMLPMLLESLISMSAQIITGIAEMLPQIVAAVVAVVPQLITALLENMPLLLEAAITLLLALVDAVPVIITELVAALPQIINAISEFLSGSIDILLEGAIALLMAIVEAIPTIIDALVDALPEIIETLVDFLTNNIDILLEAAIVLLMAIVDAIPKIVKALAKALPKIISTILTALVKALPQMATKAGELFGKLITAAGDLLKKLPGKMLEIGGAIVNGIKNSIASVGEAAGRIFTAIWDAIKGIPKKALSLGADIVRGLWNGISDMVGWIGDKIKSFGENVLSGIKNFFGIRSPSRLMRDEVGKYIGLGMAEGIENSREAVLHAVRDLGAAATSGLSAGIGANSPGIAAGKQIIINQVNNSPKALSRREIYRQTHNALAYAGGV